MISCLRLLYNSSSKFEKGRILCTRYNSTNTVTKKENEIDITSIEETPKYDITIERDEQEILNKRNKSRLNRHDYNKLYNLPPFNKEDLTWFHETIRYKRRQFGRYGLKGLNVTPGALWPTEEEIDDRKEYEKTRDPYTIQEVWALIAKRNHENAEKIRLRDEEIVQKMAKVQQWEKELKAKIAKKEADLLAAAQRRQRIVQQVRNQFGFKINEKDKRFQLALEQKQIEDRKRKKAQKKEARTAKFMASILPAEDKAKETEKETTNNDKE